MGVLYAYTEGETYVLRGGLGKSLLAHGLLEHLELLLGHGGRCKGTKKRARAKKGVGTERGGERHGRQDSVKSCTNCECVSVCVCVPQLWTGVMKTSRFFCLTRAKTKPEVSKSTRFTPDECKHDRLSLCGIFVVQLVLFPQRNLHSAMLNSPPDAIVRHRVNWRGNGRQVEGLNGCGGR